MLNSTKKKQLAGKGKGWFVGKFFLLSKFQGSPPASVQAAKSCSHSPLSSAIFNWANVRLPCLVQLIPFFF